MSIREKFLDQIKIKGSTIILPNQSESYQNFSNTTQTISYPFLNKRINNTESKILQKKQIYSTFSNLQKRDSSHDEIDDQPLV